MNLSDIAWQELDLAIEDRQRADAPEKLKGVLAFGEPVVHDCLALAKAAGQKPDAEMKLLSDQHRFTYLRLALTIRPQENLLVRFVSLDLVLGGNALCWSMEPMKIEQELKSKAEVSFSTKFKIKLAEFGGQTKESAEYVVYQPEIEAFNLQRSDPAWELRATVGKQLSGVQLFHIVVQAPKVGECQARVTLRADIIRKGFLLSYSARRPDRREDIATLMV
jgi:hypothetical protein